MDGWPGNFERASLAPGVTIGCYTDPCQAIYQMPPGTGSFVVRANNPYVGQYPAGQIVRLGAWYGRQSPITFTVDGTNAKPARLWVSNQF